MYAIASHDEASVTATFLIMRTAAVMEEDEQPMQVSILRGGHASPQRNRMEAKPFITILSKVELHSPSRRRSSYGWQWIWTKTNGRDISIIKEVLHQFCARILPQCIRMSRSTRCGIDGISGEQKRGGGVG